MRYTMSRAKLLILLFLFFMADAQSRRPPPPWRLPGRSVSSGPVNITNITDAAPSPESTSTSEASVVAIVEEKPIVTFASLLETSTIDIVSSTPVGQNLRRPTRPRPPNRPLLRPNRPIPTLSQPAKITPNVNTTVNLVSEPSALGSGTATSEVAKITITPVPEMSTIVAQPIGENLRPLAARPRPTNSPLIRPNRPKSSPSEPPQMTFGPTFVPNLNTTVYPVFKPSTPASETSEIEIVKEDSITTSVPLLETSTIIVQPIGENLVPSAVTPRPPNTPLRPDRPILSRPQPTQVPFAATSAKNLNITVNHTKPMSTYGLIIVYPETAKTEKSPSEPKFTLPSNDPSYNLTSPVTEENVSEMVFPNLQTDVEFEHQSAFPTFKPEEDLQTESEFVEKSQAKPEHKPETQAKPEGETEPGDQSEPRPEFTPESQHIPQLEPQPERQPELQPKPQSEPQLDPRPKPPSELQPPYKPEIEVSSEPEPKPVPQPEQTANSSQTKPETEYKTEGGLGSEPSVLSEFPNNVPNVTPQQDKFFEESKFTTRYPIIDMGGLEPEKQPVSDSSVEPKTLSPTVSYTTSPPTTTQRATIAPTPNRIPSKAIVNYHCKQSNGYYSFANECDTYIQCKNYVARKYMCPDGLIYNPKAYWPEYPCVYPSQIKCVNKTITRKPTPSGQCPRLFGNFPTNKGDCGKYIVCHNGRATPMSCPNGLAFNPISGICDWPENVPACNPNVFQGFICPPTRKDQYGRFSNKVYNYRYKDSCKEYIACRKGEPRLLRCDSGLSFDYITQRCVNSDKVSNCTDA